MFWTSGNYTKMWISVYLLIAIFGGRFAMASYTDKATETNLTAIAWAHAVNSQQLLADALKSDINMIEADIVLGRLENDTTMEPIPVMGHPPATESDISLEEFLTKILTFNLENKDKEKGVKLDFKSTEVFQGSLQILKDLWPKMQYPIWLNADILPGPVNQTTTIPVDADSFFSGSKQFLNAVLSIGWTTRWGQNFTNGSYTQDQIDAMIASIQTNNITTSKHEITFPVRAGIAAQSVPQLQNLVGAINTTNKATLTIWSSVGDNVDTDKLRELILFFGIDKVYLDVPDEVSSKLNLGNAGSNLTPSLLSYSIVSIAALVFSFILKGY